MKKSKTSRGFEFYEFKDRYNKECSLQKSSLATEDCIWLGIDRPIATTMSVIGRGQQEYKIPDHVHIQTRMHLTQNMVKQLIPILQKFVKTGEI